MNVTSKTTNRLVLIRELRRVTDNSLPQCQELATLLLEGRTLELWIQKKENPEVLKVERIELSNPYQQYMDDCADAWSLINKGADGDVAAAIEVCKKLQSLEFAFLFQAMA